jgi:hypothetical protein
MTAALCVVGWLVCTALAYFLIRADFRRTCKNSTWTKGFRAFALFLALIGGPLIVIQGLIMAIPWMARGWDDKADW